MTCTDYEIMSIGCRTSLSALMSTYSLDYRKRTLRATKFELTLDYL
jgi:hypothetical protein